MKLVYSFVFILISLSLHSQYSITENMQECICMARGMKDLEEYGNMVKIKSGVICDIYFFEDGSLAEVTVIYGNEDEGFFDDEREGESIRWRSDGSISRASDLFHGYEFFDDGRVKTHELFDNKNRRVFKEYYIVDDKGRHFLNAKIHGGDNDGNCVGKGCKELGF